MVLATHPSCGCMEPSRRGSLSSGSLDARKARGQRQRDRRLQGRVARRVEGHVVDVPGFQGDEERPAGASARDDCRAGSDSG